MKDKRILFFTVLLCIVLPATELFGQVVKVNPIQLSAALSVGNVTLTATGNNASSGVGAVQGTLRNNTSVEIGINVNITGGLYLSNSGAGQNMLATRVFLRGGRYTQSGTNRYITLSAGASVEISFEAFCTDLELDDPTSEESFSTGSMPSVMLSISTSITRYISDHFDVSLTIPVQLALWRAREKSEEEIEERFRFNRTEWAISTTIMSY